LIDLAYGILFSVGIFIHPLVIFLRSNIIL
ncbi:MAG: hypothetical protein ACI8WT_004369, partial [Clostridium sp.]